MKLLDEATAKEDYILVVEGSVPAGMPEACMIGGRPFGELLLAAAKRASGMSSDCTRPFTRLAAVARSRSISAAKPASTSAPIRGSNAGSST